MSTDNLCVLGGGQFLPPGHPQIEEIKQQFKLPNPAYRSAMGLRERGKWIQLPEKDLFACQQIPFEHPWGGGIAIPRAATTGEMGFRIVDKRTMPAADAVEFQDGFSLRSYQEDALESWNKAGREGVIVAPCGSGKTAIGLAAIGQVESKALVLVHTKDLATQWIHRCESTLKTKATMYGGGKRDDSGRVVVATFQTLDRMRWVERYQWAQQFGLCIVDEAHHVPAATFCSVLFTMPARNRLGLTATPNRPDGLTRLLWWHLGPMVFEITNVHLAKHGHVVPPRVEWLYSDWKGPGKQVDWPKLITKMTTDHARNEFILERVCRALDDGRQVLLLSDRVAHCEYIAEMLRQRGYKAEALVGKLSKGRRQEIIEKAGQRALQAVCATTVADEGLDLPSLDTVVLTTPTKALGRVQQRIGRVMRPHPLKKEPLVIDLIDDIGSMRGIAKKRMKLYTRIGCRW